MSYSARVLVHGRNRDRAGLVVDLGRPVGGGERDPAGAGGDKVSSKLFHPLLIVLVEMKILKFINTGRAV